MKGLSGRLWWTDGIRSNWSEPSCCTWQIEAAEVSDHHGESGIVL